MYKERYIKRKQALLSDLSINPINLEVINKFLTFEEYKLKRKQGLTEVDERSYKTLYGYSGRLRTLNRWFNNKPWAELTIEDIKKLIDDLEDGKIINQYGKRYMDRSLYYQMLQGKLFSLVGKSHIAREIIEEFSIRGREFGNEVRYIDEESFRKIVDCAITPEQKCLLWLAFDVGENINSLLAITKADIRKQINTTTNEPEYLVILSKDILKRSRTPRSELTNYKETARYLDIVLANLKPAHKRTANKFMSSTHLSQVHEDDKLFKFAFKSAEKFLKRAVELAGIRCLPAGQRVTWKDLRSSMACDLLKKGWSRDEVNARLGHRPSSRIIDRYINYLALDKTKPKKIVYEGNIHKLEIELERHKEMNKLSALRFESLKREQDQLKESFRLFMANAKVELKGIVQEVDELYL
ncbi:MAG TPA: tyrosine-type recombinase/integrase [Candidatus Nanoarchaeia archaeon]|nr:tyrosine-type recombinase/integrase [Candidatus Nanoarchaeia archaeon]